MKKTLGVAAIAALFAASAMAATVDVRVVTDGNANLAPGGGIVNVFVQTQLSAGSDGLALIGWNLTSSGSGTPAADLCDTSGFLLLAPALMANFDRLATGGGSFSNFGLTNPSASPNLSGYSGTCDGTGGLLQLGGGQNTIGNTPGNAPYPIGTVDTGVGNSGYVTIAEGFIDSAALTDGSWTICADTVFANELDSPAAGPPYAVSESTVGDISGCLVISAEGVNCPDVDANCDGQVTAADLAVVVAPANWLMAAWPGGAACDRADINNDNQVTAADLAAIVAPAVWLTSHGPCTCVTSTPGAGGCPTP
jgi:hypothetical protein